ncbi:MAG: hypothetical protein UV73_C0003G0117 [Candidatus Gottesmanbacteria bacterium GW2011_GWA2_43_14]|uniref:Uncharacterized protein n=1 Tax=Candidatus Gottesmanbacteria bacterium GW2011_GWA2_43_14 TaxID=1618443 RepID=A0A0G1DK12_9BACT|nr:MAG: hypothetical protein UV73_C0003G0117 [Candidatus Gottesmanbacteria bacterium GW2011_GWA2_43_14]
MKKNYPVDRLSATYLRFQKQIKALRQGKIKTVKQLALEARQELILKSGGQLLLI